MDFVDVLPANRNAVDLQDLVSLVQEATALCCPALYHPAYHHAIHVVTHCCALLAKAGVTENKNSMKHVCGGYRKEHEPKYKQ